MHDKERQLLIEEYKEQLGVDHLPLPNYDPEKRRTSFSVYSHNASQIGLNIT